MRYNVIRFVSVRKKGGLLMSGTRITFRKRVVLQDRIESKTFSTVTELAKILNISRTALYQELKKT